MRPAVIATLSRFRDIFEPFAESVEKYEPDCPRCVVADEGFGRSCPGWTVIEGIKPFCFARNANLVWKRFPGHDVFLCNDDTKLMAGGTVAALQDAAEGFGLVSPRIYGGVGTRAQKASEWKGTTAAIQLAPTIAFVSVMIPWDTYELVGPLDERFDGYGEEDTDYCRRVTQAGLKIGVCGYVAVEHGRELANSNTYRRVFPDLGAKIVQAQEKLREKWD